MPPHPAPPRPARGGRAAVVAALLLILAATSAAIGVAASTPPPRRSTTGTASVTLDAKWGPTPYVLEAVEFLVSKRWGEVGTQDFLASSFSRSHPPAMHRRKTRPTSCGRSRRPGHRRRQQDLPPLRPPVGPPSPRAWPRSSRPPCAGSPSSRSRPGRTRPRSSSSAPCWRMRWLGDRGAQGPRSPPPAAWPASAVGWWWAMRQGWRRR